MQNLIDEARERIVAADERGAKADWRDVAELMKHDRVLAQCISIVVETMLTEVENRPKPEDAEESAAPHILTPSTARRAVLRALDAGQEPGPALGSWIAVDRAAEALFRSVYRTLTAPDTRLHLSTQGFVEAA